MIIKKLHTLCVMGAEDGVAKHIETLLRIHAGLLDARWQSAGQADAEVLLVDPDSVYGHMDWLRAQTQGRRVITCTHSPDAHPGDFLIGKPVDPRELANALNRLSALLEGHAAATADDAKSDAPDAPTQAAAAEIPPAQPAPPVAAAKAPPAPEPHGLVQVLEGTDGAARIRLQVGHLPTLLIDRGARRWYAEAGLKMIGGWCTHTLSPSDQQSLDETAFARAIDGLQSQPFSRLYWLNHLIAGGGRLADGLHPAARYRLNRWPQIEREFPKHFRIATVMMKGAGTVDEIAEDSNTTAANVANFINAYHALDFIAQESTDTPGEGGLLGGLFGRSRKLSTAS